MRRSLPALLALTILASAPVLGGELAPGLAERLDRAGSAESLKVLVVLRDRPDLKATDRSLSRQRASRAVRHRRVISELRSAAARSQGPLLARLERMRSEGSVLGWSPHWIVNSVVVRATAAGVLELAARPDVERVEPDLPAVGFEPVSESPAAATGTGIGVTPGVRAVKADRVWYELGVTGRGTLVGSIDTGVDANHPALRDRWRGNSAPVGECWLDVAGTGYDIPFDTSSHGTHIMGTLTGQAPNDSIGVAPGAQWIASNATIQDASSEFDSDILITLEWLTDPDGDPETTDDVPDVVQNSWGVYPGLTGVNYPTCYSLWWDAMDACEAAGVVLVWSAGNEGPDPFSNRSPADRATTPGNAFSVGSVNLYDPLEISYFSSRGPSGCDSVSIKPEVVAPGHPIYSSVPGGGYYYRSGTSMAGPHAAGIVALMRSVDPDLEVATIKQILMDTAVDMGDAGEDNDYGHGLVDALAAVKAAMGPSGKVIGEITGHDTGEPVPDALITVGNQQVRSDSTGTYSIVLREGERDLTITGFGFTPASLSITIFPEAVIVMDAALTTGPRVQVHGFVYDPEGLPVSDAVVSALDTPVPAVTTGPDGVYSLMLPPGDVYRLQAVADGLSARVISVAVDADTVLDIHLPRSVENFETGGFSLFPWVQGGDAGWEITDIDPFEGSFCARSGSIANGQESSLSLALSFAEADTLSFRLRVSTENTFDVLRLNVDGQEAASWTGELPWSEERFALDAGGHTLSWIYVKDESGAGGGDTAWIDLIHFPELGDPPLPIASVAPASFEATLASDERTTLSLALENSGQAALSYSATVDITGPGAGDRPSPASSSNRGGPDGFGYFWIDSDAYLGPVYDWVEISSIGTPVTFPLSPPDELDDDISAPIPMGFTFPFYGNDWDQIRVCTNGFLSFSSSTANAQNVSIPNTSSPNDLIAPLWSDLRVGFWTGAEGPVYTWSDPENGRFIVQYRNAKHLDSGTLLDFEVLLESDGDILCQYSSIPIPPEDAFYTVGIENSTGTVGLETAFAEPYLHDELALLFTTNPPPAPWISVTGGGGSVDPLQTEELAIELDSGSLEAGVYLASVVLETNDPLRPEILVPVQLTVDPVTAAGGGEIPSFFALGTAVPNPFNPSTMIRYDLPAGGAAVTLRIYDAAGRMVRTLVDGYVAGGSRNAMWDGRDSTGRPAPSGVYLVRLTAPGVVRAGKIALVK